MKLCGFSGQLSSVTGPGWCSLRVPFALPVSSFVCSPHVIMTLSELGFGTVADPEQRHVRVARGVGVALGKCLQSALEQGRLTIGIWPSAMLLRRMPQCVLLCLLPAIDNHQDYAQHIHHTLLSAFCWEHNIRLLRVDGHDLMRTMTKLSAGVSGIANGITTSSAGTPDFSCILIQVASGVSFEEEVVLDFHDEVMNNSTYPKPVLRLPG